MTTTVATLPPHFSLETLLDDAGELKALPQVVMRVIDLTVAPKSTAAEIERVLGTDQALAGKVLTLANSAYYGLPRRVSSLREAVVFLGFKSIRNLAMAITTFNIFVGRGDVPALARRALWRHSLDTAQCARILTSRLRPIDRETFSGEEAFTGGLLHDIGKLVLDQSRHALFVAITKMAAAHGARFGDVEAEVMPFTHAQLGEAQARRWELPEPICEVIGCHHAPRAATLNPRLTAAVSLANEIAHHLEDGKTEDETEDLADRCEAAMAPLRLGPESLRGLVDACRAELDRGLSLLSFGS